MADPKVGYRAAPEARVLPFRGGEGRAPSSALLRQALESRGSPPMSVRAAMAVAAALGEDQVDVGGGLAGAVTGVAAGGSGVAELAARTGLTAAEVTVALTALRENGLLSVRDSVLRLDPDLYCTLPALAEIDWSGTRRAISRGRGRMAPALGLLRELARLSRRGADGGGEWLQPSVQELAEEALYGRTAVTQALGDLATAGLIVRADQPARNGLRLRLAPRAFRGGAAAGGAEASSPAPSPASSSAGTGVTVEIGGATIGVPAGSRLELPAGLNYRLDIAPDGRAIIRVDD